MEEDKDYNSLTKKEKLLHDLIFGDQEEYEININEYINEIKEVKSFTYEVVSILKQCGLEVDEQVYLLTKDKRQWVLKVKRKNNE